MRTFFVLPAFALFMVVVGGCSTPSNTPAQQDMAVTEDLALPSSKVCGKPGDKGNSLGVGKYCTTLDDCATNTKATICSILGNSPSTPEENTYFCVAPCSKTSPAGFCGENAFCECTGGGCGCTPAYCVDTPDGGTVADGGKTADGGKPAADM